MLGRLTNTLAVENDDDAPVTVTHSWSPTDVNPPSSHTTLTGSPVTKSVTSDEVGVVAAQASKVGSSDGACVGNFVGCCVGFELGILVGILLGINVGGDVGETVGTFVGLKVGH
jgi:hypothetical protein